MRMDGDDLLVRLFNAAGADDGSLQMGFKADGIWLEELDGRKVKKLDPGGHESGRSELVELSIPRYGVRTIRFINAHL